MNVSSDGLPSARDVLESLVAGRLPVHDALPAPPSEAIAVFDGSLDPLALSVADRHAALSSWLGPALLVRFAPYLPPADLWSSIRMLRLAPLGMPQILEQLYVRQDVCDAEMVARTCTHLETLLDGVDTPVSPRLVASLGLPWSLGRIVDSLTVALEAGASPPTSPSAVQPLVLVLDRLGVSKVWDLLPAARGALSHRAREAPLDVLAGVAESLNLLGAAGTATRALVLLLLLSEPSRVEDAHRRLLTRLVVSRESRVPPNKVVDVWSLANR